MTERSRVSSSMASSMASDEASGLSRGPDSLYHVTRNVVDGLGRSIRVEPLQGRTQAGGEDDLGSGLAAQRTRSAIKLVVGVDRLPVQRRQQGNGRSLDEGV